MTSTGENSSSTESKFTYVPGKESCNIKMNQFTRANGSKVSSTAMADLQMEKVMSTKVIGSSIKQKAMESSRIQTAIDMKVSGSTTRSKA